MSKVSEGRRVKVSCLILGKAPLTRRASEQASRKSAPPCLPNNQTQSCMSSAYVLSILRSCPIFQTHHSTPHLPSSPRRKRRLFSICFIFSLRKLFFQSKKQVKRDFEMSLTEPSPRVSAAGSLQLECDCGVSVCPPARPSVATETRALVIHRQITQFTSHLAAISSSPVTARAVCAASTSVSLRVRLFI